jgi:hypothetical protein
MTHKPSPSRHVHRHATDEHGNLFLLVMVVWTVENAMSARIWSVDGKAEIPHRYFPKASLESFGGLRKWAESIGLTIADENEEISSKVWSELPNLRSVVVVSEKVIKVDDGYASQTVYKQPWFDWTYTVTTDACLSKQGAIDSGFAQRDKVFKSCSCLLIDKQADKAAKSLNWD